MEHVVNKIVSFANIMELEVNNDIDDFMKEQLRTVHQIALILIARNCGEEYVSEGGGNIAKPQYSVTIRGMLKVLEKCCIIHEKASP